MLTKEQRERLTKAIAKTKDSKLKIRMSIFLLIDKGYGVCEIAEKLNISRRTAYHWLHTANPDDINSFQRKQKKERKLQYSLTTEQKTRLENAVLNTKDYKLKTRYLILLEASKGLSVREIAIELGITYGTAEYWFKRGNPDDLTSFDNRDNSVRRSPIKLTPEAKELLLATASKTLPGKGTKSRKWKLDELAEELERKTNIRLSGLYISILLRRDGVSLARNQG